MRIDVEHEGNFIVTSMHLKKQIVTIKSTQDTFWHDIHLFIGRQIGVTAPDEVEWEKISLQAKSKARELNAMIHGAIHTTIERVK
jgi:hypothetical protein